MQIINWVGGKGFMVDFLKKHMPKTGIRTYVEPFGGGGSLLLNLDKRYPVEVYNDIDMNLVNLFRVLQDSKVYYELKQRLNSTLYSRDEFRKSIEILKKEEVDELERAWAMFVHFNQGFSGIYSDVEGRWGRNHSDGTIVRLWYKRVQALDSFHERLKHVFVENRNALDVIKYYDHDYTLFYLDPPYPKDTRITTELYKEEASDEFLEDLVELIKTLKAKVMLSSYPFKIFNDLGWRTAFKDVSLRIGNKKKYPKRREMLYMNYDEDGLI